ncbi:MAG: glycosyltransferase family 4 protein [Prevotella sp.]|nr:glycosyltransferase family 4 protein [Prevotella sp.]
MSTYIAICAILLVLELLYFKIASHFNIIDKPNQRSSHTRIVLRGGGIIFTIALWLWSVWYGFQYPWLLAGVTLAAGVSFVDDIRSLPDSLRLVVQFASMFLVLYQVVEGGELMANSQWWELIVYGIALIVCVGATNIYNFMDGINGITGGYSLAVLVPLAIENGKLKTESGTGFVDESLLAVIGLSLLVFCFFNFRTKAKCFAGDVGSIGIALILLFCIGKLIVQTGDVTWLLFLLVYGVDGCLTIIHRIQLRENLGEAHRKHTYQLMANELHIPHVVVSCIYMALQLMVSLVAIFVIPDTIAAHWAYLLVAAAILSIAYVVFMKRYYHLHEEYLSSLQTE